MIYSRKNLRRIEIPLRVVRFHKSLAEYWPRRHDKSSFRNVNHDYNEHCNQLRKFLDIQEMAISSLHQLLMFRSRLFQLAQFRMADIPDENDMNHLKLYRFPSNTAKPLVNYLHGYSYKVLCGVSDIGLSIAMNTFPVRHRFNRRNSPTATTLTLISNFLNCWTVGPISGCIKMIRQISAYVHAPRCCCIIIRIKKQTR